MTSTIIKGIGVSEGIRMGTAFVYAPLKLGGRPERKTEAPDTELEKLRQAKARCLEELAGLIEQTKLKLGEEKAGILKGQVSFLNDPTFFPPMEQLIIKEGWSAETAVCRIALQIAGIFEKMDNAYMQERAADIKDVGSRLLAQVLDHQGARLTDIRGEVVLIADDLTPSDTVQLDRSLVQGFVTRIGGKTSHTAILAQSLGIAAVLGVGAGLDEIRNGDPVILNGSTGECYVRPEDTVREEFLRLMDSERTERERLAAFAARPAATTDGFRVEIAANIGTPAEAEGLLAKGAEAVGLYRTEFLFMGSSTMPGEELQFEAYKAVAESMEGQPVVIRTLDIGGDKELPYLELQKEMNPFLGYRAIRLCLDRQELLRTQLRAVLRASAYGNLKIMFPMISGLGEWRQAKAIYTEVRTQLEAEGAPMAEQVELGIMVEIPSAAVMAHSFAKEVDFFSIGTNDLVQYTVAVDRMNEKVSYLYDYFHPAVIRLIKNVIDAANAHGKWAGMCGSMAGDRLAAPLLLGLGLHEWSMSPGSIHKVKETVAGCSHADCVKLGQQVLELETPEEIRGALTAFLEARP
jgi:phosphoenolpyruvate-protein phosphotransferase (PTS system enzyme I)